MKFRSFCSQISCRNLIVLLLTLALLLACPLIFILVPILALPRLVVIWMSKIFKSHEHDGGTVDIMAGNLVAAEFHTMYKTGTRSALYATAIIDGPLDIEEVRREIFKMINRKKVSPESSPKSHDKLVENDQSREREQILNPQLRQTLTSWLGYKFWQWVPNFQIQNYVREFNNSGTDNGAIIFVDEMPKILKEVTTGPFTFGESPWEVLMWKNGRLRHDVENKIKTILVFRFHHCLGDGYGLFHLLLEGLIGISADNDTDENGCSTKFLKKRVHPQPNGNQNIFFVMTHLIWTFLKNPFDLVNNFVKAWDSDVLFRRKIGQKSMNKFNVAWSQLIPIEEFFEIKRIHGCTFHSVLYAAFTGGIRHFGLQNGLQLPKMMHSFEPVPMAGPSYTSLDIRTSVALGKLPVNLSSPRDRIKAIHEHLMERQNPACPHFLFYAYQIVGRLPAIAIKFFGANYFTASLFFYHVVPKMTGQVHFLGRVVDDVCCGSGPLPGNVGIVTAAQNYNGFIRLSVSVDDTIVSQHEKVQQLMQNVRDELDLLGNSLQCTE